MHDPHVAQLLPRNVVPSQLVRAGTGRAGVGQVLNPHSVTDASRFKNLLSSIHGVLANAHDDLKKKQKTMLLKSLFLN